MIDRNENKTYVNDIFMKETGRCNNNNLRNSLKSLFRKKSHHFWYVSILTVFLCLTLTACKDTADNNATNTKKQEDSNQEEVDNNTDTQDTNAIDSNTQGDEQDTNAKNSDTNDLNTNDSNTQSSSGQDSNTQGSNTQDSNTQDSNTQDSSNQETSSEEVKSASNYLEASSFSELTENRHNIFSGSIGSEKVIMDIYIEDKKITITFVGKDRTTEYLLEGSYKDYGILAKNEDNTIILVLNITDNGTINGDCYHNGLKETVSLTYKYITGGDKLEDRYTMGEESEVTEKFAQDIIDAVNNESLDYFKDNIVYPIKIHGKKDIIVLTKNQLKKKKLFTKRLKTALNDSFSKFMYSDEKALRIGNDTYNIWITYTADKKWVIYEINN